MLSGIVRTSARKYVLNGVHRMQWIFYYMFLLYKMGCSQDRLVRSCLLYTSDAADERSSVDLGGRRIIKKKKRDDTREHQSQE